MLAWPVLLLSIFEKHRDNAITKLWHLRYSHGEYNYMLAMCIHIWEYSLCDRQLYIVERQRKTTVFTKRTLGRYRRSMADNIKYYVVKQKALPEVLLKVAEANRIIENENISVADATEKVGISRSSYYKYKDDIFPFRENVKGKTITFVLSMDDEPGLLSLVLKKVAEFKANILTIHQTIPVNGIASLTLSVDILPTTGDSSEMIEQIERLKGVRYLKILSSDASI